MGKVEHCFTTAYRYEIAQAGLDGEYTLTVYARELGMEVDIQVRLESQDDAFLLAQAFCKASFQFTRIIDDEFPKAYTLGDLIKEQMAKPTPEMEEVYEHLRNGKPVCAIKAYRKLAGCGLKEAKEAVDEMKANGLHLEE